MSCENETKDDKKYENKSESTAVSINHKRSCIGVEYKVSINKSDMSEKQLSQTPILGKIPLFRN